MSVTPQDKRVPPTPGGSQISTPASANRSLTYEESVGDMFEKFRVLIKDTVKDSVDAAQTPKRLLKKDIRVDSKISNEIHEAVVDLAKDEAYWNFKVGFREGDNPKHTSAIILRIRNKLGPVDQDTAYKGCRTYVHTLKRQDKLKRKEKLPSVRQKQRRRQRLTNARYRRLAVLNTTTKLVTEEDKEKLRQVLATTEYVSSEESEEFTGSDSSGSGAEAEAKRKRLVKRPLPWRSDFLNRSFEELDAKARKRSGRSRRGGAIFFDRRVGKESAREEPEDSLSFACVQFEDV